MNKTKIEWVRNPDGTQGYTSNPIKGICKGGCSYCYSRRLYKRFKWNPIIGFDDNELWTPLRRKEPSGIFLGSMHDIFGFWIQEDWIDSIFTMIEACPQHRFYLLTKFPENVTCQRFHKHRIMPDNVWFGITITGEDYIEDQRLILELKHVEAKIKFISFEPLLGPIADDVADAIYMNEVDWIIIGGKSGNKKFYPPTEWVKQIEDISNGNENGTNIPIFEKDNLCKTWNKQMRQEFPKYGGVV